MAACLLSVCCFMPALLSIPQPLAAQPPPSLCPLFHCGAPAVICSRVAAGWVRVGGVLASLYGWYYIGAALDDVAGRHPRHFYASTIAGRLLLSAAFAGLVAARQCEPALLWLAAANAASSLLLWRASWQRQRDEAQAPPAGDPLHS